MPVFPTGIDVFSNPQGTTLVSTDDHANQHRTEGSAIVAIENKLGLGAGSSSLNQILVGSGAGTSAWGSVWNNAQLGTPTITKGTATNFTENNGTIGTPAITGGTFNNGVFGTPSMQGGTANGMVLGTPTIGTITIPGTINPLGFSAAIAPGIGTIVDAAAGTMTINAQLGNVFYSAMGTTAGNRTIGTPLNPGPYQQLTLAFKASGSANGTLLWASVFRFSQDIGTPAIGTGTTWNYFNWRYNNIDTKWDFLGQSKNIV